MTSDILSKTFEEEIGSGARFRFGANWARFTEQVDSVRIDEARRSLERILGLGLRHHSSTAPAE